MSISLEDKAGYRLTRLSLFRPTSDELATSSDYRVSNAYRIEGLKPLLKSITQESSRMQRREEMLGFN